jgi:hypothetical protein
VIILIVVQMGFVSKDRFFQVYFMLVDVRMVHILILIQNHVQVLFQQQRQLLLLLSRLLFVLTVVNQSLNYDQFYIEMI